MAIVLESGSEMKLLLRSLRPEIFRLIIVQYNHRKVIDQVAEQIQYKYPDRSLSRIQLEDKNYRKLMDAIYQQGKGVLIIEDFHKMLNKPEVYVAFNQRRDKIAQYPLALICFIPIGNEVLQECIKKLPDFWSFRNLLVKLEWKQSLEYNLEQQEQIKEISTIGGTNIYGKEEELNRLIARVEELQPVLDNLSLINSYYPQILQLLEEIGAYQKGLEYAGQFMEIAEKNHYAQNLPSVYSDAINWKAQFYKYLGNYAQARGLLERALTLDITNYGEKHSIVAIRKSDLGLVYRDLGEYEKARDLLEEALKFNKDNFGERHPEVAKVQSNLGLVYKDLGQYSKAKMLFEEALISDRANYGERHPNVEIRKSNLANLYYDLGAYQQARDLTEEVLELAKETYGEKHPKVAFRKTNLANIYLRLGENEKALELLISALKSDIENFGEKHPRIITLKSTLGVVYKAMGKIEMARDLSGEALALAKEIFGERHYQVARTQYNLALIYRDLGENEKARDLMEGALQIEKESFGERHPDVAVTQNELALLYIKLGNYKKARELLLRAYQIFVNTFGEHHPKTKEVKSYLQQIEGK